MLICELPDQVHEELRRRAAMADKSLRAYLREVLTEHVAEADMVWLSEHEGELLTSSIAGLGETRFTTSVRIEWQRHPQRCPNFTPPTASTCSKWTLRGQNTRSLQGPQRSNWPARPASSRGTPNAKASFRTRLLLDPTGSGLYLKAKFHRRQSRPLTRRVGNV